MCLRFRTTPFRAYELSIANISSTQKSMKEKYDGDIGERLFNPGQKVHELLPMPGNALHSTFGTSSH